MVSSDTFYDFRNELNEQWKHHTINFLPVFTTVTENALAKLLEKLPKKFDKSLKIMLRKVCTRKSLDVTRTNTGIRSQNISTGRDLIMQKHKLSRTIWLKNGISR